MRRWHGLLCAKYSGTLLLRVTKESIPLYTVGVLNRTGAAALPVGREPCGRSYLPAKQVPKSAVRSGDKGWRKVTGN